MTRKMTGDCQRALVPCAAKLGVGTILLALVLIGCHSQKPVPSAESPNSGGSMRGPNVDPEADLTPDMNTTKESAPNHPQSMIDLVACSWTDLQKLVSHHKGKVIVVDVWSTSCEPCMKEYPNLVALQKAHPDEIAAISYNVDFVGIKNKPVDYYRDRVLKFLASMGESGIIHRMSTKAADELFQDLQLDSIPAIYVYDRTGHLAKRFEGVNEKGEDISYQSHVIPLVEQLIAAPATVNPE